MDTKIQILIQNSRAIPQTQKRLYLKLIEMIPAAQVLKLQNILEQETQKIQEIQQREQQKKSEIYKKTITEVEEFFKKAEKTAISKEEQEEKSKGEDLLNQLDNL